MLKKQGKKKITPQVVSSKPWPEATAQVTESAKVGGLGNRVAPINYSKKGK